MWSGIRGRLAFWGFFLTIVVTVFVIGWDQYVQSEVNLGQTPVEFTILGIK